MFGKLNLGDSPRNQLNSTLIKNIFTTFNNAEWLISHILEIGKKRGGSELPTATR